LWKQLALQARLVLNSEALGCILPVGQKLKTEIPI